MSTLVCIRFTSGEEAIGKLSDGNIDSQFNSPSKNWVPKGTVTLNTVSGVTFQQVGKHQIAIAFVPFTIASSDKVDLTFNLDTCAITVYPPSEAVEKEYLSQTSGIALATPGLKM